jgi:hypothetical protein
MGGSHLEQQIIQYPQQTTEYVEQDERMPHEIIHVLGDYIGWTPLLIIVLLGLKKNIRGKIVNILKELTK